MAINPKTSKRQKELLRLERRKQKETERERRKQEKKDRVATNTGEDPDIAGIVPGPQPRLDDELPAVESEEAESERGEPSP